MEDIEAGSIAQGMGWVDNNLVREAKLEHNQPGQPDPKKDKLINFKIIFFFDIDLIIDGIFGWLYVDMMRLSKKNQI